MKEVCLSQENYSREKFYDDRSHNYVKLAGIKFGGTSAGRDEGSNWVVRLVELGKE